MDFIELESKIVGMCLNRPKLLAQALDLGLTAACFEDEGYRIIFATMMSAEQRGLTYNSEALRHKLPDLGEKMSRARLDAPVTLGIAPFAKQILDLTWSRRALSTLKRLAAEIDARRGDEPLEPFKRKLTEVVLDLTTDTKAGGLVPIGKAVDDLNAHTERQMEDRKAGKPSGISTGFKALDMITGGGFSPGSINTFAARTGRGKTTLAVNFLRTAAMSGHAAVYFTIEMPYLDITRKLVSLASGVSATQIRNGQVEGESLTKLAAGGDEMRDKLVWICDSTGARFEEVESHCRRLKRQGRLDLIVLDYLQQFTLEQRHASSFERISAVSHRLKQLALELNIAVVSLAQLNREAEKGESEPDVHHLMGAGSIEQDSDLIVLIHSASQGAKLFVGKNRNGKDRITFPVEADLGINAFRDVNINFEAFR